jgi:bifunctional NMN adenylyltransferase/nudix hydrolase
MNTTKCKNKTGKTRTSTWPISFQSVDVVIYDLYKGFLLGRKVTDKKNQFRFIGGYVDVGDESLEDAAERETSEEANLSCVYPNTKPIYLFSSRVEANRYKDSKDKLMTAVFLVYCPMGDTKAGDDIVEVKWFKADELMENYRKLIAPVHKPIFKKFIKSGVVKSYGLY